MAVRVPPLSRRLLTGFAGGLNLRDAPGELDDTESPDMMNVTLDERGGVVKRLGYQRDNADPIYQIEPPTSSVSGNEITDTTRVTNSSGDGWPYYPFSFEAGGETNNVGSTDPWTVWEGLSAAFQLFYGTTSPTPRHQTHWVKYVVRPGDKFGATSGERSEHHNSPSIEAEGQEHWYRWSTQFPTDFVRPSGWCIFTQIHSTDAAFGQAPFKWQVDQLAGVNYASLVVTTGPFADAGEAASPIESNNHRFSNLFPLTLGVWHDIIMRIRFSSNEQGTVQAWHRQEGSANFTRIIDAENLNTIPKIVGGSTSAMYLKQGLYRNDGTLDTISVFHDGFARGNTFNEMNYNYGPPATMGTVGIWPATTNLHTNGSAETNTTGWVAQSGSTITRDLTEHKFGVASIKCVTDSAQSASSAGFSVSLTNGTRYTYSAWVKGVAGQRCRIYCVDSTSANLGQFAFTGTGQWQKVSVSFTATANNNHAVRIGQTGTGTVCTYYIDGAELEALRSETPYVHTDGSTAARSAARVQYDSSNITAAQGWVSAEWRMGWNSSTGFGNGTGTPRHFDWTLDANNYLRCYYDEATTSWKFERKAAGTGSTVTVPLAFVKRQRVVVTAHWTATAIKLSIDGFPFASTADANIPTGMPANFDLGSSAGTAEHIASDKNWVSLGTGTLTDDDARTLGDAAADPFPSASIRPANLYYSEALQQLFLQLGTRLFKRTSASNYTEVTRAGPLDAYTTAAVAGFSDLNGILYTVHPVDGVSKYTGSGSLTNVNTTVLGNALATWQNKLWATGVTSTVWWSNAGNGDTWTTGTDFIQVRDVNDAPCTAIGFGQALDSGSTPASGLLVYKRGSTHRISSSSTGEYRTLSAEAGAIGPRAVAHLNGITMSVNDKGVWITDGEASPLLASGKLSPLFRPTQLQLSTAATNTVCGVYRDRFLISLSRLGSPDNDLTLEFQPEGGWFAAHDLSMLAYATLRLSDNSLYALSATSLSNLVKMFVGGADDILANGAEGDAITCRFRTRWFEPVNGTLTRIRRMRLQHRGAFGFYIRRDFSQDVPELVLTTPTDAGAAADLYGTAIYGLAHYGASGTATERYSDVYSLGTAKAWAFELQETSSRSAFASPLLDGLAPEVGAIALYELHADFVSLSHA